MDAGQLITDARNQAGLTQTELASRMGTHQSVVARWETGKTQPSLETLARAVEAAGLELTVKISARDAEATIDHRFRPNNDLAHALAQLHQQTADQARLLWIKGR
jgi:transcriptional regulator with XRE-family HTH domain